MLTQEQMDKVSEMHKPMAKRMEAEHTERNAHVTDVDLGFVDETTYGEVIISLNPKCHSYTFTLTPPGTQCILDYSIPVRNGTLNLLQRKPHGAGEVKEDDSPVTDEERSIFAPVARHDLAALESAWEPIHKAQVTDAEIEWDKAKLTLCKPGDTVVLVAFEVNQQHASGLINVVYPVDVILKHIDRFRAPGA